MIFFLLLEIGMVGVFLGMDLFLFYIFLGIYAGTDVFLDRRLGRGKPDVCRRQILLYTMAGSIFMLLAIIWLGLGAGTFAVPDLIEAQAIPANAQFWLFLAFAAAFAIKVPMWPLHSWLPDAHVEAPTAGSVILAGVLLKWAPMDSFVLTWECFRCFHPTGAMGGTACGDRDHLWRGRVIRAKRS